MICKNCGKNKICRKHDVCTHCYATLPEFKQERKEIQNAWARRYYATHKEQIKAYNKIYYNTPEQLKRKSIYYKEYFKRPEVKAKLKQYRKNHTHHGEYSPVCSFYDIYNRNTAWQRDGIEKMSELFASISCGLSGKEACDLQERILKVADKKLKHQEEQ